MKHILFIILLLVAPTAVAQQYLAQNFSTQDGLSHANVYRIFEDRRGFLWFCTDYGLTEYNGQTFNSTFDDKDGLLNGSILQMAEDSAGTRYASSYIYGPCIVTDSSIIRYPISNGPPPRYTILVAPDKGRFWMTGKPFLYKIVNKQLSRCDIRNKDGAQVSFYNIVKNADGLLLCSSNGIYRIEGDTVLPWHPEVTLDTIMDICRQKNGTLWLAHRNRIQQVVAGKAIKDYPLTQGHLIKDMLLDSHNNLWVALDGEGMLLLQKGELRDITNSLPQNKTVVNDMLEDHEGNIWIATYGAGVFRISNLNAMSYRPAGNNPNIFCYTICGFGPGRVLIGSIGKISILENGLLKPFPVKSLRADMFIYIIKKIDGNLYIGTQDGLLIKNVETGAEKQLKYGSPYAALFIQQDAAGTLALGGYNSLALCKNNEITTDSSAPLVYRYNEMCYAADGSRWFATGSGVMQLKPGLKPKVYRTSCANDVIEDARHRIWAATDEGLLCIDNGKQTWLKKEHGMAGSKCNRLLIDHNNKLWVGTISGLSYVDLNTVRPGKYVTGIYRDDILSLYCDSNNKLYVGTATKLLSINTAELDTTDTPPPLYITYVKTPRGRINMPASLKLAYNENKLQIGFIALSYQLPASVEYRYRIKGLDDSWYQTRNSSIELSALPPGNYTFILNARKDDGRWSNDVQLQITIAYPFWRTWWFNTLVALVCIGTLFLLIRAQMARRHRQLLLLNKIAYLKQQALSALINPHFIFNCMNSIQYYMDNNENDKANAYLADFAHLIRITMEDAQKVYISLEAELHRIKLYLSLEQLRFGEKLAYDIHIDPKLSMPDNYIPNMILQPYVENAIWHGIMPRKANGHIQISFLQHGDKEIKIIVQDNGAGINSSKKQPDTKDGHYGMRITQERLTLLKQLSKEHYAITASETKNEQGEVTGTHIEIILTAQPADMSLGMPEEEEEEDTR